MGRRLVARARQAKREGSENGPRGIGGRGRAARAGEPVARIAVYAGRNHSTFNFMKNSCFGFGSSGVSGSFGLGAGRFRLVSLVLAGAALAALTVTSGCLAVAAGAGAGTAVAYVRGDLDTTLNANFDRSDWAVNEAIKQLQFAKVSEKRDALQAIIIARNAADKKIELRLDKLADDATKLKIRVGTFGDDTMTQAVLERVKANLPVR